MRPATCPDCQLPSRYESLEGPLQCPICGKVFEPPKTARHATPRDQVHALRLLQQGEWRGLLALVANDHQHWRPEEVAEFAELARSFLERDTSLAIPDAVLLDVTRCADAPAGSEAAGGPQGSLRSVRNQAGDLLARKSYARRRGRHLRGDVYRQFLVELLFVVVPLVAAGLLLTPRPLPRLVGVILSAISVFFFAAHVAAPVDAVAEQQAKMIRSLVAEDLRFFQPRAMWLSRIYLGLLTLLHRLGTVFQMLLLIWCMVELLQFLSAQVTPSSEPPALP